MSISVICLRIYCIFSLDLRPAKVDLFSSQNIKNTNSITASFKLCENLNINFKLVAKMNFNYLERKKIL